MLSNSYEFRNSSEALPVLLEDLLEHGSELPSRNGPVHEFTNVSITLTHPWERELLVEGRKPNLAAQIAETMWVLSGRNDVGWLSHYLPRAKDYSDDGLTWRGGYGPRLRSYGPDEVDQVAHVIDLLKEDPETRRAVVNIYDAAIDSAPGLDIPCNTFLIFMVRDGRLDLNITIRSNDIMWGWSGINAFEWSVLQELVAACVGVEIGSLHFNIGSLHLYEPHFEKARKIVQSAPPEPAHATRGPRLDVSSLEEFDARVGDWFRCEEDIRNGVLPIPSIDDSLLGRWLETICWWWSDGYSLDHWDPACRLYLGTTYSLARSPEERPKDLLPDHWINSLLDEAKKLHAEKHAAYGDSWKRRGETLGILANIARKIDRLAADTETSDETQLDTAMDLMIYLAKYRDWLGDLPPSLRSSDHVERVDLILRHVGGWGQVNNLEPGDQELVSILNENFDDLEECVVSGADISPKAVLISNMLVSAVKLSARRFAQAHTS